MSPLHKWQKRWDVDSKGPRQKTQEIPLGSRKTCRLKNIASYGNSIEEELSREDNNFIRCQTISNKM